MARRLRVLRGRDLLVGTGLLRPRHLSRRAAARQGLADLADIDGHHALLSQRLAARHLRVRHPAAARSAHDADRGRDPLQHRRRRHRLRRRTVAAVRGLLRDGDRLDAGERRRADQYRRPLVLRKARACHQPCADRRKLRRHHPDAADGGRGLALGLSQRDARHRRRHVRDPRRDRDAVCRQAAETCRDRHERRPIRQHRRRSLDARRGRCAACSSGP